jgi:hypothetical protein
VERGVEDIREPSKLTPGFISESRNHRSTNGSTLRRWIAATTPAVVRPSAWSFCRARRRGWSFSWFSRVAPPAPVIADGGHHSLRKGRQHPIVILEIKPPVLPPLVRRHKGGRDVLLCAPRPQLEGAAASPHRHTDLLHVCRHIRELRGEEMGPQVPVGVNPQKPLANRCENGRLRDGVGVEVVKLHPVVVRERPHEAARRHPKPPLMKRGEADHIPRRRSRVGLASEGQPLRLRPAGERTEQTLGNEGLQILRSDGGEGPQVARRNAGRLVSHCRAEAVETEGTRCAVFSLSTLSGCKSKGRRQGRKRKW